MKKVLWFTNTPSLYDQGNQCCYSGGWIESLEELISKDEKIELGVCFFHATDSDKVKRNNTTYFPVKRSTLRKNPVRSLINNWSGRLLDNHFSVKIKEIVDNFQPDVIHVFGTEGPFAMIQDVTSIPVVIHLQGLINPCLNTYFPINQSKLNFLMSPRFFIANIIGNSPVFNIQRFRNQARREAEILNRATYVMGRTHWDKMIAELYNPGVTYFHVDEVLRPLFYEVQQGKPSLRHKRFTIVSTLSPRTYKGIDVLLRSAKKMTEFGGGEFHWQVIGLDDSELMLKHYEAAEGVCHRSVNIECKGRKSPKDLVRILTDADVFVHPSYIDNSPNSVCEAQILGLPVIACDVGGISSLIQHGESGFLVPSNGIFEIVFYLKHLKQSKDEAKRIGKKAATVAQKRHNRIRIVNGLKKVYLSLCS